MALDVQTSLAQLVRGFEALSDEYKTLARRHQDLERKLAATTNECDALREILPERLRRRSFAPTSSSKQDLTVQTQKSLLEFLEQSHNYISLSESVAQIKDAEATALRIRPTLEKTPNDTVSPPRSSRSKTQSDDSKPRRVRISPPLAEDPNETAVEDAPRCPFAAGGSGVMPADHPPVPNRSSLPTPRSSQSIAGSRNGSRRSKRMSFHDPLKPDLKEEPSFSPAHSAASGPACPIRYLNDHSPEEIAKYFEQHKGQLPRSHEVCIKRFVDNAQSIRQLDAKYGNLVSMIQGLGQKHQPMLPDIPSVPEEGDEAVNEIAIEDDRQSNQKIQAWAEQVTDSLPEKEEGQAVGREGLLEPKVTQHQQSDQTEQDEDDGREQRFDRTLKDVRLGESPSRPWGVPIPARYLDRDGSGGSWSRERSPRMRRSRREQPQVIDKSSQAAKCPVEGLMAKMTGNQPARSPTHQQPGMFNRWPDTDGAASPAAPAKEADREPKRRIRGRAPQRDVELYNIVNNGIAIVSDPKTIEGEAFVNHGTLIMGYEPQAAMEMYTKIMSGKR